MAHKSMLVDGSYELEDQLGHNFASNIDILLFSPCCNAMLITKNVNVTSKADFHLSIIITYIYIYTPMNKKILYLFSCLCLWC